MKVPTPHPSKIHSDKTGPGIHEWFFFFFYQLSLFCVIKTCHDCPHRRQLQTLTTGFQFWLQCKRMSCAKGNLHFAIHFDGQLAGKNNFFLIVLSASFPSKLLSIYLHGSVHAMSCISSHLLRHASLFGQLLLKCSNLTLHFRHSDSKCMSTDDTKYELWNAPKKKM